MRLNRILLCTFLVFFVQIGCTTTQNSFHCKPVLFPYPEYRYKAESYLLDEAYALQRGQGIITFYELHIPILDGWHYEKAFKRTLKISKSKQHFFLISMRELKQHPVYFTYVNSQYCDWSGAQSNTTPKTEKEYYTDLYLFTDSQLTGAPGAWPWQYMILWSKTNYFYDAMRLIHYKGKNLEAFQKDRNPYIQPGRNVQTVLEIFPDKISSRFFEIGSHFKDDAFFADFVNMLNVLNH